MRDADWLTAERARAWCRVLAAMTTLIAVGWIALSHGGVDITGKPLGTDFVAIWAAWQLALAGTPALAYAQPVHQAAQVALFPAIMTEYGYTAFFYPPIVLLPGLLLGGLPYLAALAVWLGAGLSAFVLCLRRVLRPRWALLPILAFPGMLENAGHGQNGFFSGACFGGFMLLAERRPFLAGASLGVLVFKPQLMVAAPVALLAGRRWWAILGAACSAALLCGLSWLMLGTPAWRGFFAMSAAARATMEQGLVDLGKMQSVFAGMRVLGAGIGPAYAAQAMATLAALGALGWIAARRPGGRADGALLVAATMLCTPYLFDYDLVCMALPLAWIMAEAQLSGWRRWEKIVLLAAYVLPMISRPLAMQLGVPIAPLVLATLLLIVARRAAWTKGAAA